MIKQNTNTKKVDSTEPVRFISLGGFEEVGRNMMFFEYKNEIIIIDAGLQFPEETTPGIDYIIPNIEYLEKKKKLIRGLIITHGHYDHIGAIPHILGKLGNPLIYTTRITAETIKKRQEDYPNAAKPQFDIVSGGDVKKISKYFTAEFFGVTHNIPDGVGIVLKTPIGKVVHPGEFKFDYDEKGKALDLDTWKKLGKQNIHTLLLDSTAAEVSGHSVSERVVEQELEKLIKGADGRIILASFASLLDRLAEVVKIAEKLGRKVAISGYSMKTNFEIAKSLGYIKTKKDTIIPIQGIKNYPDKKILILSTGAQGEPRASLTRIANGTHKFVKLKKTDTVIFSSSVVPGNEHAVQVIKDNLARQSQNIFHNKDLDIHSSGHAPAGELREVMKLVKPRFFVPIHGHYFMRMKNAQHAKEVLGLKEEEIAVPDNGKVTQLKKGAIQVTDEEVPTSYVMVDGLGVGDVSEIVLRDRRMLAAEGMIVVIMTINKRGGRLVKNPDIISRGFIYLKENKEMLNDIRRKLRGMVEQIRNRHIEPDYLKSLIRDQIGEFVFKKTKRRPMVLPVVIEV